MNILHLSAAKIWGGGENHLENLCVESKLLDPSIQHTVLCIKGSQFHCRLIACKLDVVPVKLDFKMDPRYIFRIITTCKNRKIDIVHIHDTTALTLAVLADHLYKLPPFIFSKKTSYPIKNRERTLHKYNYPKIKKVLCVSEETKRVTAKSVKDYQKLTTVYHGTRVDNKSTVTPFMLRELLQISKDKKIIGNIANHTSAKDLDTMIQVADILINKKKRRDLFFVQIGTFTKRSQLLQMKINDLNLQSYFKFFDFLPEASNFIPQFHISLVTSHSEGIPGFIYESFYHKVPVVSTAVGGIPEVIEHGYNGLLAAKYDSENLGKHIVSLCESKTMKEKFCKRSRTILLNKFITQRMAQQTLLAYHQVLNYEAKGKPHVFKESISFQQKKT